MKCPRDGTELAQVQLADVELDKCHKCDGIWFDPGELEKLRDTHLTDAEEILEEKYGDPKFTPGEVDDYMRCPRCDEGRLQEAHYTYINPVKIDRCDTCLGIWLDDSELNAIVQDKKQLEEEYSPSRLKLFARSLGKLLKN